MYVTVVISHINKIYKIQNLNSYLIYKIKIISLTKTDLKKKNSCVEKTAKAVRF